MNESTKQASDPIQEFLSGETYAVVGASTDRSKYGNKVLRAYQQLGKRVFAVNPRATEIEGVPSYPDLGSLPEPVWGISVITPPAVTETIVEAAARAGIPRVWMQPGAESRAAVDRARELGLQVIAEGPCLLVAAGYRE